MITPLPPAPIDKDALKQALALPYVCAKLGINLNDAWTALCPFHADGDPSFRLYDSEDGTHFRWHCFPCGDGGDIFDLIQRVEHVGFGEAVERAAEMLAELPPGYEPPRPSAPARIQPDQWAYDVQAARDRAAQKDHAGILAVRSKLMPPARLQEAIAWDTYLRRTWGWGISESGSVYMPHWSDAGELTGCKVRDGLGGKQSLPGSRYEHLYGAWLLRRHRDVLLCEGEMDTVWAAHAVAELRIPIDVFGLPSGASAEVSATYLNFLTRARTIFLAFDPDAAGVEATRRWITALQDAGMSDVRVCALPLGRDLRDTQPDMRRLLTAAKHPLREPDDIQTNPGGYVRFDRNGQPYSLCSWTLEPMAQLVGGDEPGLEVELRSRGGVTTTTIRYTDLTSVQGFRKWAAKQGEVFPSREGDVQVVATLIKARGAIVPEIFQTAQVGMHSASSTYPDLGQSFVHPTGYYGQLPWRYVPSGRTADVTDRVLLPAPGRFNWAWLEALLHLSSTDVTHPLLAWTIAAARRPEYPQFPLLFIGGSSGVGKSTIARVAQRLAGSAIELSLGANTPFILYRTLASSRSLPVFVDEWTLLSRRDTREAMQSAIPDLYAGGLIERGQADLSASGYRMLAPTIVAGEDVFTLDRERERMIALWPTRANRNVEALALISSAPLERFAHQFYNWLISAEGLPPIPYLAPTRIEHNRQVLLCGWETLRHFLHDAQAAGEDVPVIPELPDLSCFERADETADENIYEAALREAYPLRDSNGNQVVWPDQRGTWIRPRALIGTLHRAGIDLQLPGGERALISYFKERYTTARQRVVPPLAPTAVWAELIYGLHIEGEQGAEETT